MACSVCRGYGCNKNKHIQKCVICGQDERVVKDAQAVDKGYKCEDSAKHERIRHGFGNNALISESRQQAS